MDRGPMTFTSDVSLPKDDKKAMQGKKITTGQLTGLKTQCNANYATKERKRLKSMGSRPTQNISLVLSCESHPKCKSKATDSCIKRTLRKVNNPCTRKYKHRCFPLVATTHPLVSCFCHSS